MDIVEFYKQADALLEGHFLLSSGKHSPFYLQSAKVLENPKIAQMLATSLGEMIKQSKIPIDCICSPALGGILAGYELARALGIRFIFTERVQGVMNLRRGFSVSRREKILVCEDIITTGGSAMECARVLEALGGEIVGYAALINRGICKRFSTNLEETNHNKKKLEECKLNIALPLFALGDFVIETYEATDCPLCKQGSVAIKPGSRGN